MSTMTMTRSRSRCPSIRRPSLLLTITVLHPRLPLGRVWLPLLSLPLWGMLVLTGLGVCFLPAGWLEKRTGGVRVRPIAVGLGLIRLAGGLLCNGGYVLCDVHVPDEQVRV